MGTIIFISSILMMFIGDWLIPYADKIGRYMFYIGASIFVIQVLIFFIGHEGWETEHPYTKQNNQGNYLEDALVEKIDGHTIKVKSKGRQVIITKDRNGNASYQKLNTDGNPIGKPVQGSDNAWRFGKSPNQTITDAIKEEIDDDYLNWTREQ